MPKFLAVTLWEPGNIQPIISQLLQFYQNLFENQ